MNPKYLARLLALGTISNALTASPPLSPLRLDPQGRATLEWVGLPDGVHAFQSSTNLKNWTEVFSGKPVNGTLTFLHTDAPRYQTLYYRGLAPPGDPGLVLVPHVLTNLVASTVITPWKGGTMALGDSSGVQYVFSVGPSNVVSPMEVRMKVVAQIENLPHSDAFWAAVQFEPDGFHFHGAGMLEITFPTAPPVAKMASFSFGNDGGKPHFVPDLVRSNQVRIPVKHFSNVGTAAWAKSDREAAATAFRKNINEAADQLDQQLAQDISNLRDNDPLLEHSGAEYARLLENAYRDLYQSQLQPQFEAAEHNCDLAGQLLQRILAIERHFQMLQLRNSPVGDFFTSDRLRKWRCNCLDEALRDCEEGLSSTPETVQTILDMERGGQLFGANDLGECGFGQVASILETVQTLRCLTPWYGVVTYYEDSGEKDQTEPDEHGTYAEWRSAEEMSGDLFVVDAKLFEKVDLPGLQRESWRLLLEGTFFGLYTGGRTEVVGTPCGRHTTQWEDVGSGKSPIQMMIELIVENGVVQAFQFIGQPDGRDFVTIPISEYYLDQWPACKGESKGKRDEQLLDGVRSLRPIAHFGDHEELKEVSAAAILGSVTRTGVRPGISTVTWDFRLLRRR
jgi:hypothetical protein